MKMLLRCIFFLASSTGGRGVDGEERIECTARGYPKNIIVTTEKLSSALSMVVERLPGIIIANSIDVSGTDICTEYASISACTSCFFWVLQADFIRKLIQPQIIISANTTRIVVHSYLLTYLTIYISYWVL